MVVPVVLKGQMSTGGGAVWSIGSGRSRKFGPSVDCSSAGPFISSAKSMGWHQFQQVASCRAPQCRVLRCTDRGAHWTEGRCTSQAQSGLGKFLWGPDAPFMARGRKETRGAQPRESVAHIATRNLGHAYSSPTKHAIASCLRICRLAASQPDNSLRAPTSLAGTNSILKFWLFDETHGSIATETS
jgi:hypothetical protein